MRRFVTGAALLAVLWAALAAAGAQAAGRCGSHPWCDTSLSPDRRAALLLAQLTRDEKISLLAGDEPFGVSGGEHQHTGTSDGIPRLDVPTIYFSDGPAGPRQGKATAMPAPMALAATWSPRLARLHGSVVGNEVKDKGNDVVFAPTVNIMRTPLGGRTFEGYGEDPFIAASMAVGWIRGAQAQGVVADVKHYAANNQEGQGGVPPLTGPFGSRFLTDAVVAERALREIYLQAFEAAVKKAKVGTVMCAYNRVNGAYACENGHLLQEVLRRDWGFKGFVLADYGAAHPTGTAASLNHGLDFEPWPGWAYSPAQVNAALLTGQSSDARLDEHVRNILRTWFAYGVFDRAAYRDDDSQIDKRAHARATRRIEEQAITLLKNRRRLLPLRARRLHSIALIGEDADRFKEGGGSAQIDPFSYTTPRQGIERRAGKRVEVRYDPGDDQGRAADLARHSDVAIVVAADSSSEGSDKRCMDLNCTSGGRDLDGLIRAVAEANPRTVVVLETGAPVLTPWRSKVGALVEAWYPGAEGGTAIARVLFGDADPGGRLPVTFPRRQEDLPTTGGDPESYPGDSEQRAHYKEGVLVGYRWLDAKRIRPAYPFGYGLSYTRFRYSRLRVGRRSVSATVTNVGRRRGTAVAELYVGIRRRGLLEPPRQLKGFRKVRLRPGRSKRVRFRLHRRTFSYWSEAAGAWAVARGCHRIYVGPSSRRAPLRGRIARGGARCRARRPR